MENFGHELLQQNFFTKNYANLHYIPCTVRTICQDSLDWANCKKKGKTGALKMLVT